MDSGNKLTLYGHFCTVEVYTNGTVDVKEKVVWKRKDDLYCATFLSVDDTWIEVRVSEEVYNETYKNAKNFYCRIEGRLRCEVSFGSGIVSYYVLIE